MKTTLLTAFLLTLFLNLNLNAFAGKAPAKACEDIKAAFDIGSGTTKIKVAKVDTCRHKILQELLSEDIPVGYKEDLAKSPNNSFSTHIIKEALESLRKLKFKATKFSPKSFIAAATSAFRTSKNGVAVAKIIETELGIPVHIITQTEEARLGFNAVAAKLSYDREQLVVWDIGGGSMQISSHDSHGNYQIYEGKLASVSFKNRIIKEVLNKDVTSLCVSPNPLSFVQATQSMKFAEEEADRIPQSIRKKLLSKKTKVIGIGGVHYYSLRNQIKNNKKRYTKNELAKTLKKRAGKTDQEIGGNFASTEISNMALVLGFMNKLNINKVETMKINIADGLLVSGNQFFSK